MKFGQEFRAALLHEEYPEHWGKLTISYKELKKYINQLRQELATIGLNPETIAKLANGNLRYTSAGYTIHILPGFHSGSTNTSSGGISNFEPKLIVLVEESTELPLSASIEPETKAYLRTLVHGSEHVSSKVKPQIWDELLSPIDSEIQIYSPISHQNRARYREIELPLKFDSVFFKLLSNEILGLNALQAQEEVTLKQDIVVIGRDVSRLVVSSATPNKSKADLYAWREALHLYTNCCIFFSTLEQETYRQNSSTVQIRLRDFLTKLEGLGFPHRLKTTESRAVLQRFLRINLQLLQNVKFQELNSTAARKIIKSEFSSMVRVESSGSDINIEFAKQTALREMNQKSDYVAIEVFSSSSMAKAVCFEISEKFLAVVPQLRDFECPVCTNISYKPIRLRCGHVFCIRCMIHLQRANNDHCPLCRGSVIMEADGGMFCTLLWHEYT